MNRIQFIVHKNRKILVVDASGCADYAESVKLLDEAEKTILAEPARSVLLLTNVTGIPFNREMVVRQREFSKNISGRIRASTIVGIDGMKKVVVQGFNMLANRKIEMHPTVEEAKDWLALQ